MFLWPVRVYYEDTDSGGVVYYANYLKFMERARTEWLRALGFEQDELISSHGVIFAVRSVQADYLAPARFNDKLLVTTELQEKGKVSLTLAQNIHREHEQQILCSAQVKIVSLSADGFKPVKMPGMIYEKI